MPNSNTSDSVSEMVAQKATDWVEVAKSFGVPTVAMGVLMWFAWTTIDWERKLMLPAIERNNMLVEKNTDVMEVVIRRLDVQLSEQKPK